ncbi:HrcA family transcriptional regulator [Pseudoalteromonas xiamenensis]|uniref:Heat-inducible transcription repressor HrcA n=1 Tax=Pseudoalteromonas xiamenensis TaxID=882626 RepID=A0A975DIM4_9GAMM|nr:HrcA family transcriptional regulator [Pseudoalteromonas xiamenensis]QTH71842.1 HrcA family transcriptional regulator [Pseudoalteromonas xiamenensis]
MNISPRDQLVFSAVMSLYCDGHGVPVASSKLVKQTGMAVCSATVRNAMARLEKAGLLYSPHTSAGRVPTEDGFKFWFEQFFDLGELGQYWQPEQSQLVEFAHTLSQKYKVCCCVGLPQVSSQTVFRVEILDFDADTWLVLLIDRSGQSNNICINKPEQNSDQLRYQFATWLNTVFSQQSLMEGLHRMRAMANTAPAQCKVLLAQWTRVLAQQLGSDNSIVVGERHLYNQLELTKELQIGVNLLHWIEDRLAFKNGVSVLLPHDLPYSEFKDCIVLSVPYFANLEYQSRFCIIAPRITAIESLITEFSAIGEIGVETRKSIPIITAIVRIGEVSHV